MRVAGLVVATCLIAGPGMAAEICDRCNARKTALAWPMCPLEGERAELGRPVGTPPAMSLIPAEPRDTPSWDKTCKPTPSFVLRASPEEPPVEVLSAAKPAGPPAAP